MRRRIRRLSSLILLAHSHPDPSLIGQKVSEDVVARDGKVHLGTDSGSTGTTANARVPVFGDDGRAVVGEVSVGIRESSVAAELLGQLPLGRAPC